MRERVLYYRVEFSTANMPVGGPRQPEEARMPSSPAQMTSTVPAASGGLITVDR